MVETRYPTDGVMEMLLRKVVAGLSNQKLLRPLLHAVLLYIFIGRSPPFS